MSADRILRHGARVGAMAATLMFLSASSQAQAQPSITTLLPSSVAAGNPAFSLSVIGSNFGAGPAVLFNGVAVPTSLISSSHLTASIDPALLTAPGTVSVTVRMPNGSASADFTIEPPALSISTLALPAAAVGVAYSFTLRAAGGEQPLVWTSPEALPPGLALAVNGSLTGTPTAAGTFAIPFRVTDAQQRSSARTLSLTVNPPPFSIATSAALPAATEGIAYSIVLQAQNGAPPLRWQLGSGAPTGLTLNSSTGTLSGVPSSRGTYTFSVEAIDAGNLRASKTFTLTVQPPALSVTTTSLPNGNVGSSYSQTFSASGGTPPYRWSMTPSIAGLTLDANTGVLTGTPASAATHSVSVQVRDNAGVIAAKTFSFVIDAPRLTIVTSSALPDAMAGLAYSIGIAGTGGTEPYSWATSSGQAPGLTLDPATGVLSGTPTAAGAFSFTVQASDAAGRSVSKPFTLTVAAALEILSSAGTWTATVLAPFTAAVSATGGVPPYTWSANGLPQGLSIDSTTGEIQGVPQTPGTFPFAVQVADANQVTVTRPLQLQVAAPALPSISAPDVPQVSAPAAQHAIRVELASPYSLPLSGQLLLSFSPDAGGGDRTIQFSTGGRMAEFTIPQGSTSASFSAGALGIQTGTVAGSILLTARFASGGAGITPTPLTVHTIRVEPAAPAITEARFSKTGNTIQIRVTGYATSREVTQAAIRFSGSTGASIVNPEVTLSVERMFAERFADPAEEFGSQFIWTQEFTVQGDVNAVTPVSVRLTNRVGTVTADIKP